MSVSFIRLPVVCQERGFSRTKLYDDISKGLFTKPVRITSKLSGWARHEVDAINSAVLAGRSPDEIKQLVARLHESRKAAA